jgi:hypothetical protein
MSRARLPVLEKFIADLRTIWSAEADNQRRMEKAKLLLEQAREGRRPQGAFGELALDRGL